MCLEMCSKCGRFIPSDESVLRLNADNDLELICDMCLDAEKMLCGRLDAIRISNYVSAKIVDPRRSSELLYSFSR